MGRVARAPGRPGGFNRNAKDQATSSLAGDAINHNKGPQTEPVNQSAARSRLVANKLRNSPNLVLLCECVVD